MSEKSIKSSLLDVFQKLEQSLPTLSMSKLHVRHPLVNAFKVHLPEVRNFVESPQKESDHVVDTQEIVEILWRKRFLLSDSSFPTRQALPLEHAAAGRFKEERRKLSIVSSSREKP